MKRNYIISLFAILICLLSSCEKFLNNVPENNESVPNFYKTESDIQQAVNAAYQALAARSQYGELFIDMMEIRSDNSTCSATNSGGIYGDIDLFRESTYNVNLNTVWVGCYDGIKRANIVLDKIDAVSMSEENRNKYVGEMLFIRALTYFNLVRFWGDVPLIVNYVEDPFSTFTIGRTPASEVYSQIIQDLKDAIALLPANTDKNRRGAAISSTAKSLLGKVYITLGEWESAKTVLKEVIDSKVYSFESSYATLFDVANKNGKESVFEIQYTDAITDLGSAYANLFAPTGSTELTNGVGKTLNRNLPTDEFVSAYDSNDKRKEVSIGTTSQGIYYCKKFVKAPVLENQSDANFIVLRYTDVLMMYAEALNEIKYIADGEAFNYLNMIRTRAGLKAYTSTEIKNQNEFREAILNERRFEFAFENQRWFDLVRTGKAVEIMNRTMEGDYQIDNHNLLYPIPQTQRDIVPGVLTQNPGY